MPPVRTGDADLVEATRRGDRDAYAELWRRHAPSARTVAVSHSSLDADDLVAEAFTKVFDAIRAGGGPNGAFRPYLFTTLRNTAASWGRAKRETALDTLEQVEDPSTSETAALESLDRSTTARAFRALPTRWQEVLWYSEVERMPPAQVAPLIGMSANATAALAYRAREGLRQEWIRAHLRGAADEPGCRWTTDRLGAYTRGRLRTRDTAKLESHLDRCARCTIVAAEAREVGSRLALVLLPLAAGIGAATAYSAWLQQAAPMAHAAMGAAGTAGTAGGLVSPIIAGTAEAGATVTVTASGGLTATAVADAEGSWSLELADLPAGTTTIIAEQTDAAGNRSAPSSPVDVTLSAPVLSFTAQGAWLDTVFTGVPGATIQVLADGVPIDEVVLDGTGQAGFDVLAPANHMWTPSVRYVVDDRTGPAATADRA